MLLAGRRAKVRSAVLLTVALAAMVMGVLTAPSAPAATRTLTFGPTADTSVRADQPTATAGSATELTIEGSPIQYSFLRFSVSGVGADTVESSKLRLYVTDGSPVGGVFSRVANTTWSESSHDLEQRAPR